MIKQLPYGTSSYSQLITGNFYYVDKTNYIEKLEREVNPYQFFIRPRKFGKSLFLTMLDCYYNINKASQFETLFKDTYIGKHPTSEKNIYAVINFDFSGLNTGSADLFIESFQSNIQESVCSFFAFYAKMIPNAEALISEIKLNNIGIGSLFILFNVVTLHSIPLYVIIDEYDHFANDLIALGKDEVYKKMIRANGIVRDFYETLKKGTKSSLKRIFITGISPVMLDDLTSGFNIAGNLTLDEDYNEMMGFTQSELNTILDHCKVDPQMLDMNLLKTYYDGYLFSEMASERVYNPSMLFYYLNFSTIKFK